MQPTSTNPFAALFISVFLLLGSACATLQSSNPINPAATDQAEIERWATLGTAADPQTQNELACFDCRHFHYQRGSYERMDVAFCSSVRDRRDQYQNHWVYTDYARVERRVKLPSDSEWRSADIGPLKLQSLAISGDRNRKVTNQNNRSISRWSAAGMAQWIPAKPRSRLPTGAARATFVIEDQKRGHVFEFTEDVKLCQPLR